MSQDNHAFCASALNACDASTKPRPACIGMSLQHQQGLFQENALVTDVSAAQDVLVDIPMPPSQSGSMQDVRAPQGLTAAAVEAVWTGANSLAEPLLGAEDRQTGGKGEEQPDAPQARS